MFLFLLVGFFINVSFAQEGEPEAWSITFTYPTNGSTTYNLGQIYDTLDITWTVTASWWYTVKIKVDDGLWSNYLYTNTYSTWVTTNAWHTVYAELYYVPTVGAPYKKAETSTTFYASKGYRVKASNDFNGGDLIMDGTTYHLPHYLNFASKYVVHNASVNLEAINNQTDDENHTRVFWRWTKNDIPASTNIQYSPIVDANDVLFKANTDIKPSTPTNFHNAASSGNVTIAWSAIPEPNLQHYEIERKLGNGNWTVIATITSTTFIDNEVTYDNDPNPNAFNVVASYRIRAKSIIGTYSNYSNVVTVNGRMIPERKYYLVRPMEFSINQNYPNPFNPVTDINFTVAEPSFVTLNIFNSIGQEIAKLVNEIKEPGTYSVRWSASGLPSGVYFYSFRAGKYSSLKKMILAK